MNRTMQKLIDQLPEKLRDRARDCSDPRELMALAANEDIELSDDALEAVSAGYGELRQAVAVCNKCGKPAVSRPMAVPEDSGLVKRCEVCGKVLADERDYRIEYR